MTGGGARGLLARGSAALTVALALGTVACGSGGDGDDAAVPVGGAAIPGAGEELDGCLLVDELEAAEILRGRVLPGAKPTDSPAAATCVWEVRDADNPRSLQFSAFRGHDLYDPGRFEDDPGFEEVEGVGEGAFFADTLGGVGLEFLADEHSALISVSGFDGADPLDKDEVKRQLVDLAKRVVQRL